MYSDVESDSDAESAAPSKYFPFQLGESENLERYEPGGFHPTHLGDTYDDERYKVVHKLGFGGFSTVWLARDTRQSQWVALKIVAASDSAACKNRLATFSQLPTQNSMASGLLALPIRQFWIDGPNGRHICLVLPVTGPSVSHLSNGIYCRMKPSLVAAAGAHAVKAVAMLHSCGICHGDLTPANIALSLSAEFHSLGPDDIYKIFGEPRTDPIQLVDDSGESPRPHVPEYGVMPLGFRSSTRSYVTSRVQILDFDQSYRFDNPPESLGTPPKHLAPEVAVGEAPVPASDTWALGSTIFRMRSGDDIFFENGLTDTPADALLAMITVLGKLPEKWHNTLMTKDGYPTKDQRKGRPFQEWWPSEPRPLKQRVAEIWDAPPAVSINGKGEAQVMPVELAACWDPDDLLLRAPFSESFDSMIWRPTAICVDGGFIRYYGDETEELLKSFPKISEEEASLFLDLLSKTFAYDPADRISASELIEHPWFLYHTLR